MVSSHRRIKDAVTAEVFQAQVTNRFGLVLTDETLQSIAGDMGWSDSWFNTSKRRPKAPPPKSGDLAAMFVEPGASPMPSPLMNPLMPPPLGPTMMTPPPRASISPKSGSPVSWSWFWNTI